MRELTERQRRYLIWVYNKLVDDGYAIYDEITYSSSRVLYFTINLSDIEEVIDNREYELADTEWLNNLYRIETIIKRIK